MRGGIPFKLINGKKSPTVSFKILPCNANANAAAAAACAVAVTFPSSLL